MANELAILPLSDFQDICEAVRRKTRTADLYTSRDLIPAIYSLPDVDGNQSPSSSLSGHVDRNGLAALGWSAAEIDFLQANVWWSAADDDKWLVANSDPGTFYKRSSGSDMSASVCAVIEDLPIVSNTLYSAQPFFTISFSDNDMSVYTSMRRMFYNCHSLRYVDCSRWQMQHVSDITDMFRNCESLESLDLRQWDTSSILSLNNTFYGCRSLKTLRCEGLFSNVTNLTNAFFGCSSLVSLDLRSLDWSKVSTVTGAFGEMYSLRHLYLDNLSKSISVAQTNLTHESLMYIIDHMATVASQTFTIGAVNMTKLSADEKAIAISKGWTLA